MQSRTLKGLTVLATSTSLLAVSTPAKAQLLDEMIVTAQKREQNLQDVPISINAFDLEDLEAKRITGIEDIAKFSPGVYTTPNPADETGVRVNIRGIGTFDPQIGQDARTAVYLDGVYYGRSQGLAFDSPDLGRVEILKGPQGTLYGRNTVSGAINIVSVAPDSTEFSAAIDGEYGNFNHVQVKGHINTPIAENLALRVSGLYSDIDGWVENTGVGEDFGGTQRIGGRAALRWDPTDQLTIDIAGDYTNTQSTPLFHQALPGTANPGSLFAAALTPSPDLDRQDEVNSFADIEEGETEIFGISGTANYGVNETDNVKLILAYREADSRRFVSLAPTANPAILAGIINADVSPAPGLQSFNSEFTALPAAFATAGQPIRPDFASQFDGSTPADTGLFVSPPGGAITLDGHEQFSAELTYTGSWADKIDYTAGLFYFDEQTGNDGGEQANLTDVNSFLFVLAGLPSVLGATGFNAGIAPTQAGLAQIAAGIMGLEAGLAQIPDIPATAAQRAPLEAQLAGLLMTQAQTQGTLAFLQNGVATNVADASTFLAGARQSASNTLSIDTQAFAVYGEATWHLSDEFRLTGGLRYSDDRKDGVGQAVSPFFLDNIDLIGNVIPPNVGEADTDSLDFSFIGEWDATENALIYASYKEAFRSGGFNSAAVGLIPEGETSGIDFIFGKETVTAYELGLKSDLNERIRFNISGYFYDFEDFQTTVSLDPLIATSRAIVNTDQEIWGVDIEAGVVFTDYLSGSFSYSMVDGEQDPVTNPGTGVVSQQDGLQGAPENSFAVGLDFRTPIANNYELFANGTYSYKDEALAIPMQGNASEILFTQQNLLSGRIGVGFDIGGREASVSFWGENLTDDEYTIDGLPFNTFAFNTAIFGQPRTYGVAAGVKF